MLTDQHRWSLEKVIDDVRFEMVDKHHRHPDGRERRMKSGEERSVLPIGKSLVAIDRRHVETLNRFER